MSKTPSKPIPPSDLPLAKHEKVRYLLYVNHEDFPGKMAVRFVTFETSLLTEAECENYKGTFDLIDPAKLTPDFATLKEILTGATSNPPTERPSNEATPETPSSPFLPPPK